MIYTAVTILVRGGSAQVRIHPFFPIHARGGNLALRFETRESLSFLLPSSADPRARENSGAYYKNERRQPGLEIST